MITKAFIDALFDSMFDKQIRTLDEKDEMKRRLEKWISTMDSMDNCRSKRVYQSKVNKRLDDR